jgi:putative flippase GtrA
MLRSYAKVKKAFLSRQFILFLIAGGIAACVNFGSRIAYNHLMIFEAAVVCAYVTGMITAFILNKLFVFDKSVHSTRKEFYYFTLVNIFAAAQTLVISVALYRFVFPAIAFAFHPSECAHAAGVIVPVFTSFIGHKKLSFKSAE